MVDVRCDGRNEAARKTSRVPALTASGCIIELHALLLIVSGSDYRSCVM